MAADASAYEALGLEPGASSAAIEQAYKRLIKQHHPDRQGGDAKRAAEITRAYRELRALHIKDPLEFNEVFGARRRSWPAAALILVGGIAALLLVGMAESFWPAFVPRPVLAHSARVAAASDPMDEPLHVRAIDAAVRDAWRISHGQDEFALASESRNCHHKLRTDPSIAQLDRCVAFDDAVVQLQDRDPLRDQGPFSELSVTGREWSGASALSDDYLAIDGRLDRIRLSVEIAIAPSMPDEGNTGAD